MSPLFAKILAWGVLSVLILFVAFVGASLVGMDRSADFRAPVSMLVNVEASEARFAWESGGREALHAALARFLTVTSVPGAMLTDAAGTDLMTGKSYPKLISTARRRAVFPASELGAFVVSRFSPDGRYCFILFFTPLRFLMSYWQPALLSLILIIAVLCSSLAFYLVLPLRSLQRAVERFGRGDLAARAPGERRDELGDLSRAFNRMAERLETLVSAQHRLLFDISHELRSPLARLGVAVELARSSGADKILLDRVQKEADRLNELIAQMLELARAETDPAERRMAPVRLDQLIGSLVENCAIEAQVRGCALALELPVAVSVEGDRELLRRAIENVVRNAIRYAPSASKVEVAIENGEGKALVKVRDYGPGVPDAALGRIFDPFYRVEEGRDRASGGSGLGLSIARRAVELHRGSLRASNASPGLLVEIELPA